MFIVLLEFSTNKSRAGEFLDAHKDWIKRGFDDRVFLLVGSLQPNRGGGIVAYNTSLDELQNRVNDDPFVREDIVRAHIHSIAAARADERLKFLVE